MRMPLLVDSRLSPCGHQIKNAGARCRMCSILMVAGGRIETFLASVVVRIFPLPSKVYFTDQLLLPARRKNDTVGTDDDSAIALVRKRPIQRLNRRRSGDPVWSKPKALETRIAPRSSDPRGCRYPLRQWPKRTPCQYRYPSCRHDIISTRRSCSD
jgi:hypothetical protein